MGNKRKSKMFEKWYGEPYVPRKARKESHEN